MRHFPMTVYEKSFGFGISCHSELGEEYCPPSQYLLPVLESDSGKQNSDCVDSVEEAWQVYDKLTQTTQCRSQKSSDVCNI